MTDKLKQEILQFCDDYGVSKELKLLFENSLSPKLLVHYHNQILENIENYDGECIYRWIENNSRLIALVD